MEMGKILDGVLGAGATVEENVPLHTMDPLPSFGTMAGASQPPSSHLALVPAQLGLGAPGLSVATSAELDEELQRILASLYQGVEEVDDSIAIAMDLSFMDSMAAGIRRCMGGTARNGRRTRSSASLPTRWASN